MAIIVKHKENSNIYAVIGAGLGMYKATKPSFLGGTLFPDEEEGVSRTVAVCDKDGICNYDNSYYDEFILACVSIEYNIGKKIT